MRWTLTSPDGLGDFALRLPWLFAMQKAGWKLQLVCRQPTAELAGLCGLAADLVILSTSPYSKEARRRLLPFRKELRAVRNFRPELVFLGPSQPTFLEEQFVQHRRDLRLGGFRLDSDFWPGEGIIEPKDLAKDYDFFVDIRDDDSEPARNNKAAARLLGIPDTNRLEPFRFGNDFLGSLPRPAHLPPDYIAVCAGYRQGDYFQGWGSQSWGSELRLLHEQTGLPLVFVGSSSEKNSHREIVSAIGPTGHLTDLTGRLATLRDLCGVLAHASAYVGKDCGTMHIAALLGRPVLAVFGGGHRNRFHPVGGCSVVLTVDVPCRGCDWRCHLEEPLCVRDLDRGKLLEGWNRLKGMTNGGTVVLSQNASSKARDILQASYDPHHVRRAHALKRANCRAERHRALFWARHFVRV